MIDAKLEPSLILLVGLSGSGKSTVANKFAAMHCIVLNPDEFRQIVTGQEYYQPAEEFIWGIVKNTARYFLNRGHTVVIDALNHTIGSRAQWVNIAKAANATINCLIFDTPLSTCLDRNKNRQRQVPEHIIEKQMLSMVEPVINEGFDNITVFREDLPLRLYAPTIYVKHADLTRSGDSIFRSKCPIAKCDGMLLVHRNRENFHLEPIDRCIRCGQKVVYTDIDALNHSGNLPHSERNASGGE